MNKKILIIGGIAGGVNVAVRLRRLDETAEILVLEEGDNVSFANCGLPYHIGGVVEERERLFSQTPAILKTSFNIDIKTNTSVLAIERKNKELKVKDNITGESYQEKYDELVLATGAEPWKPDIKGVDVENVFTLMDIPQTDHIVEYIAKETPDKVLVVGGGYIGLNIVGNLCEKGLSVSLVEKDNQVMKSFDYELAAILHNYLYSKGVSLHLANGVKEIEKVNERVRVILESGRVINTDMVILATGLQAKVDLAEAAGLEIGKTGGIKVNDYLQTSDKNIYALGDIIEVNNLISGEASYMPLVGPTNKQARIVANNIANRKEKYKGSQGTSVFKFFDLVIGSTGLNEKHIEAKTDYLTSYIAFDNYLGYYPRVAPMIFKIIYTAKEGKILGAQIIGGEEASKRIDVLSTAIKFGSTVNDLKELELSYAPPFVSAKDPINMAGFVADNILNKDISMINWDQINHLDEETIILDVREDIETKIGKIKGAINIPLNQLRDKLNKLNPNKPIVVYCGVGLKGYFACRILKQHGFSDVKNLNGGYNLYSYVQADQKRLNEDLDVNEYRAVSPEHW